MKKKTAPFERKIPSQEERIAAVEKERKKNEPFNVLLRSGKGVVAGSSGEGKMSMNEFLRSEVARGESTEPEIATALATASDEALAELLIKMKRAEKEAKEAKNERALKSIRDVLEAIRVEGERR